MSIKIYERKERLIFFFNSLSYFVRSFEDTPLQISRFFFNWKSYQIFVMNISSFLKFFATLLCVLLAFASFPATVECAKKASGSSAPEVHEPVIEEVTQKQLERILQEKDYVAVYWCKWQTNKQTERPNTKWKRNRRIVILWNHWLHGNRKLNGIRFVNGNGNRNRESNVLEDICR